MKILQNSALLCLLACSSGFALASNPVASRQVSVVAPDMNAIAAYLNPAEQPTENAKRSYRFAEAVEVNFNPNNSGAWSLRDDGRMSWQLAIDSPDAYSLSLGISDLSMPSGAELWIYNPSYEHAAGPYRSADLSAAFTTAQVQGDEIVLEVVLQAEDQADFQLTVSRVNYGFRSAVPNEKAHGACNLDVACEAGDEWADEIRSVALVTVSGVTSCTGTLMNNTLYDGRPYILTADHCFNDPFEDDVHTVLYWNFQARACGGQAKEPDPAMSSNGTNARATWPRGEGTDMTLLELKSRPPASFNVYYAGWDRRSLIPNYAVSIHHPSADEKSISFENDSLRITNDSGEINSVSGNYLRVIDWDIGTTEPGSSGSGLWSSERRVVGQLSHGGASCSNNESDWYGRLAKSWEGGGSLSSRLKDWLNPTASSVTVIDGMNPDGTPGNTSVPRKPIPCRNGSGSCGFEPGSANNLSTGSNGGTALNEAGAGSFGSFMLFSLCLMALRRRTVFARQV